MLMPHIHTNVHNEEWRWIKKNAMALGNRVCRVLCICFLPSWYTICLNELPFCGTRLYFHVLLSIHMLFFVITLAYLPIAAQYQFTVFARNTSLICLGLIELISSILKYPIWSAIICEYMKFPLYIKCMCAIFGYIKFTFCDKLFIFIILKANSLWYMRFFFCSFFPAHFFLLIFSCPFV